MCRFWGKNNARDVEEVGSRQGPREHSEHGACEGDEFSEGEVSGAAVERRGARMEADRGQGFSADKERDDVINHRYLFPIDSPQGGSTPLERKIAAMGLRDHLFMTWEGVGWVLGVCAVRARQIYISGIRHYGVSIFTPAQLRSKCVDYTKPKYALKRWIFDRD
jgi:hypothetical protein